MLRFSGITMDCRDPNRLADFWTAALGYDREPESGAYMTLKSATGDGPTIVLQRVPEPKSAKNRLHFDLGGGHGTQQMEREVDRLIGLGARTIGLVSEGGSIWTVMADPEGNEFCVLS